MLLFDSFEVFLSFFVLSKSRLNQVIEVSGTTAITMDVLPFGGSDLMPQNRTEIVLVGRDNTNTVRINNNDNNFGCLLNGDAILGRGKVLRLMYLSSIQRFIEIGRNF